FPGYRPQFYFRTTDVTGTITLPEGVEMVMPGDNVQMTIELIAPIAMEKELRFAIREGGRTVGAGVVTEIIEGLESGAPASSGEPGLCREGRSPGRPPDAGGQTPAPGPPEGGRPPRRRGGALRPLRWTTELPGPSRFTIEAGPDSGGGRHGPREDHPRLHPVPGEELPHDEEQAEAPRARGVEEALPALQCAHAPQGDEVSDGLVEQGARVHGGSRR